MGAGPRPIITPEIALALVEDERQRLEEMKRQARLKVRAAPKPAILGERTCPCGNIFPVLRHNPTQAYCTSACALKLRTPEQKAEARAKAAARQKENRDRAMEPLSKREAYTAGWKSGYQSARHAYHWRRFLKKLKEVLDGAD